MSAALRGLQKFSQRNIFINRGLSSTVSSNKLRLAIIGQSVFGAQVYKSLRADGHEVVGVFTVPDQNGRPDPLAAQAVQDGTPVFKYKRWRTKGQPIKDILEEYKSVGADLNVLPFCSQFIPMEAIDFPKHGSIIYHPSLLPKHRGASAINWYVSYIDTLWPRYIDTLGPYTRSVH